MKNPNIIFTSPGVAELIDKEMPEAPVGTEVLVRLAYSTVSSGTERANLIGDDSVNMCAPPSVSFPRQCGYSSAGEVVAVGDGVKRLRVGDRVAVTWSKYSHYIKLDEKNAHLIEDEDMSCATASLTTIATFPMAAIRKCRLELGESAIVMGLGVLGLMAVQLLHAAGAVPIIAVDPIPSKREKALAFGADYALDPFAPDFAETAKRLSDGGVKVAIEVTGNGKALDSVLDVMAPLGRVALLGCTRHADFTIDYYRKVHGPGISLIGAHTMARPKEESSAGLWTTRDDALTFMRLEATGRTHIADLVEEVHSPLEAPAVFARLAKESAFPVVQFNWDLLQ